MEPTTPWEQIEKHEELGAHLRDIQPGSPRAAEPARTSGEERALKTGSHAWLNKKGIDCGVPHDELSTGAAARSSGSYITCSRCHRKCSSGTELKEHDCPGSEPGPVNPSDKDLRDFASEVLNQYEDRSSYVELIAYAIKRWESGKALKASMLATVERYKN